MNSDIVGTFYPLVLSHQVREGQFLAENYRGRFFVDRKLLRPSASLFDVALLSINSIGGWGFNWQLCQDSFIEGQSRSPHLLMLRSTKQKLRCEGIFRIWWAQAMIAVIGVFLAPNYRPTISLSWPRVGSASNFNQTLGRLNRRKENICLAGSTIREFGGSRRKIARNCVARTRLRGRGSQTNSTIKRFRTFVGRCFQMDLLFSGSGHDLFFFYQGTHWLWKWLKISSRSKSKQWK